MNQLAILLLLIMICFTLYNFCNDIKATWNTGNSFGEGFVAYDDIINLYGYDFE